MPSSAQLVPPSAPFEAADIDHLNSVITRSNPEQRAWLAGFLAGIAAANQTQPANAPAAAPLPRPAEPLTILYATESGNTERLAAKAQAASRKLGFKPRLLDMADGTPADLKGVKNLLVLASTWGEGEPPQRAAPFYRALLADGAPELDGVRFSVLALGDRAYANFCETGRIIDERLAALGAARIAERADLDLDFETPAADWTRSVLDKLAPTQAQPGGEVIHVAFPQANAEPEWSRAHPFAAELNGSVVLNGSRSAKQTAHLELSLEGSGIAFEPGDALSVVPQNDPALVEAVLKATGVEPTPALEERLTRDLDITTLTRPVLDAYERLRPSGELSALLKDDGWRGWLEGRQLVDLLEAFPSRLDADELASLLRPLPARAYSIASSPLAFPGEAHLLVGKVGYQTHDRDRHGVASSWLTRAIRPGAVVPVFLRPNKHFRLPDDGDRPIIMVGPGTGVAPFRAFLQHRREQGAKGRSWLFFGDRTYTHDFLYQLDWQELHEDEVLTRIDVAFSRDAPSKVYVQHRMWEHRAELWRWLQDGANFYVCGDATAMAKDVHATLLRIAEDQGAADPQAWADDLVRAGRYQRDVY